MLGTHCFSGSSSQAPTASQQAFGAFFVCRHVVHARFGPASSSTPSALTRSAKHVFDGGPPHDGKMEMTPITIVVVTNTIARPVRRVDADTGP
jgi:hypothetical protein